MKIKKPNKPGGGRIPAPSLSTAHLSVSFKHFKEREPFLVLYGQANYFSVLLQRLRAVCGMTMSAFRTSDSKALRSHPIKWEDTTEPEGFDHLNPQLREQIIGWQFSVSSNEHGRVHGFIVDEVFYVVWLDPFHRLYAAK